MSRARDVVRGVVFDLDGTLVDSRDDIVQAVQHTRRAHGAGALPPDVIASYVGDGARVLLARAWQLPEADAALDAYLVTFLDFYTAHAADHTRLMKGAHEALDALSALPLALATNKPRVTTDAVLTHLDLARHFRLIVAGGDLPKAKPDAMVLEHVAHALDVPAPALVMVGDGPQDIRAGLAVGAHTIGVLGGFAHRDALVAAGAHVIIDDLTALPLLVLGWSAKAGGPWRSD
jgi:phosphoglycolate phosphatase